MTVDRKSPLRLDRFWFLLWAVSLLADPARGVDWPNPVADVAIEPNRYVGFIWNDEIYATGFIAGDERLVFTGAHLFVDEDGNMADLSLFRFAPGYHESTPPKTNGQSFRAVVLYSGASGYASLVKEHGVNSAQAFTRDIAVAYGYMPMSDHGAIPFLEDGVERLKSAISKKILGYPVALYSGEIRGISSPNRFQMHASLPSTDRFKAMIDGDDRVLEVDAESITETSLISIPGTSGGPVVVETSPGNWGAAGIMIAGHGEIRLTPPGSTYPAWAGIPLVRSLSPEDWSALAEPALPQAVGKPVFDIHPTDLTILPGHSGHLHGHAEGWGETTYQWFKNGKLFAGQESQSITFDFAQPPQGGIYELRATNRYGTTRSDPAVLTIPTGPKITRQPEDLVIGVGLVREMNFEFFAAWPYEIKFYRNGIELEPWLTTYAKYNVFQNGTYHATVTNSHGQVTTDSITVTIVNDSGFITEHPKSSQVSPGSSTGIRLRTRGAPHGIQWYKDGVLMPGQTGKYLQLIVTGHEDAGHYHATVNTGIGLLQSEEAILTVKNGPPMTVRFPETIVSRVGTPTRIALQSYGTEPLSFQWFHRNKQVGSTTEPYLDLPSVRNSDFGRYSVRVTNPYGSEMIGDIHLEPGLPSFWSPFLFPARPEITSVACSPSRIVLTTNQGEAYSSSDGREWTRSLIARGARVCALVFAENRFVGVGNGFSAISTDGLDWEVQVHPLELTQLACGRGRYVAVDPRKGLFSSDDASHWTHEFQMPDPDLPIEAIAWGAPGFLAANRSTLVASPDGRDWNTVLLPPVSGHPRSARTIVYGNGSYKILTHAGDILSSRDGREWIPLVVREPTEPRLTRISCRDNLHIAGSYDGIELFSRDGVDWEPLRVSAQGMGNTFLLWNNRVVVLDHNGSGVRSVRLDQPILVIDRPAGGSVLGNHPFTLTVKTLSTRNLEYQWYRGDSGDVRRPIAGATSADFPARPQQADQFWVRLTRGDFTWDSPSVPVEPSIAGFYFAGGEDGASAIAIDSDGRAALVGFDHSESSIALLPSGTIDSRGDARFDGSTYLFLNERLSYRKTVQAGQVQDGSFYLGNQTGGPERFLTRLPSTPDRTAHPAAGFYRFSMAGIPFCEGAAIVDPQGYAVAVMHTTDHLISGAGPLSPEGLLVLNEMPDNRLRLEFNPEKGIVTGSFEHGETSIPLNGLQRGTESEAGLANLSSRGTVGIENGILIAGLVLEGPRSADLLVRGIGPTLTKFGIPAPLGNPRLKVIQNNTVLAENENWADFHEREALLRAHQQTGAFPLDPETRDAALLLNIPPGRFTVHVSGKDSDTGTALAEVYQLHGTTENTSAGSRLLNLSVRGVVNADTTPLVVGFVIDGDRPRQVFVRAVGPSLSLFNLSGFLPDPTLRFYRGNRLLATGADLPDDYDNYLMAIMTTIGAFPSRNHEPALVVWLNPGAYTAVVQPEASNGGVVLVEIYEIPFDAPSG